LAGRCRQVVLAKKYYFYSMKNGTTTKKPAKKAAEIEVKAKPGTYAALLEAKKIAEASGIKITWVKG
jgi:hypothetical protein